MEEAPDLVWASHLETALSGALAGSRSAARAFFEQLLDAEGGLYVPERFQAERLSDAPDYPSPFFSLLAVRDGERAVVPTFSREEHLAAWCGCRLTCKRLAFSRLAEMLPGGWWITVNPGREAEKEISPWEIDQLRGGAAGIEAVLDDLFPEDLAEFLEVRPLAAGERADLRAAAVRAASGIDQISRLFILIQAGRDAEDRPAEQLLIGAEAPDSTAADHRRIQQALLDAVRPHLIGDCAPRVLACAHLANTPHAGFFSGAEPIYARRGTGPIRRAAEAIRRRLSRGGQSA